MRPSLPLHTCYVVCWCSPRKRFTWPPSITSQGCNVELVALLATGGNTPHHYIGPTRPRCKSEFLSWPPSHTIRPLWSRVTEHLLDPFHASSMTAPPFHKLRGSFRLMPCRIRLRCHREHTAGCLQPVSRSKRGCRSDGSTVKDSHSDLSDRRLSLDGVRGFNGCVLMTMLQPN